MSPRDDVAGFPQINYRSDDLGCAFLPWRGAATDFSKSAKQRNRASMSQRIAWVGEREHDRTCPWTKQEQTPLQAASAAMHQSRHVPAAAPEAFKEDTQLPRNGATFFPKKSNKEVHHDTPSRSDTLGYLCICPVIMTLKVTDVIIK